MHAQFEFILESAVELQNKILHAHSKDMPRE